MFDVWETILDRCAIITCGIDTFPPVPVPSFVYDYFWWLASIGIADTKKVQVYLKERIFSVDQFIGVSPDLKSLLDWIQERLWKRVILSTPRLS